MTHNSFLKGETSQALQTLEKAMHCPGAVGNPFLHLRLGECAFDMEDNDRAADELTRAYMGAGREIFASENPKYFEFLATKLRPPHGQGHL